MSGKKPKYIAIKPRCFDYWVWFKAEAIEENGFSFIGSQGWGRRGALTSIDIEVKEIAGRMESDELQYD